MRYITRPFEINAVQWTGDNKAEVKDFVDENDYPTFWTKDEWIGTWPWEKATATIYDDLHDTWVGVMTDDYIIKGMKGECYPCNPEVFHAKYETPEQSNKRITDKLNQLRSAVDLRKNG